MSDMKATEYKEESEIEKCVDIDWNAPDYKLVWEDRRKRLEKLRAKPKLIGRVKEYYQSHPVTLSTTGFALMTPAI